MEVAENSEPGRVANDSGTRELSDSANQSKSATLTAAEFRSVLHKIDNLGFTWTSELPPSLVTKDGVANGTFASKKLEEIQNTYPEFPNALGYVIWYAITGTQPLTDVVGTEEDLQAKSAIVWELLITPEFRDEFFFRHMLKIPSFDNVDWEIVVKTAERGVQRFPGNAYAMVSILLEGNPHYNGKNETVSFAINESRLAKLIKVLDEMRVALQRAREIGHQLKRGTD